MGSGADETLIGGASYVALPSADGARAAEVAFTIEEDYQGQGLASKLLALLVDIARQHGIAAPRSRGAGGQCADDEGVRTQRPAADEDSAKAA